MFNIIFIDILILIIVILSYKITIIISENIGIISTYKLIIKEQNKTIDALMKQLEKQKTINKDVEI